MILNTWGLRVKKTNVANQILTPPPPLYWIFFFSMVDFKLQLAGNSWIIIHVMQVLKQNYKATYEINIYNKRPTDHITHLSS